MARSVWIAVDRDLPSAARWALGELTAAMRAAGWETMPSPGFRPGPTLLVGGADSPGVRQVMSRCGLAMPEAAESLLLHRLGPEGLLIAGRDERGLVYALLDAARAVELGGAEALFAEAEDAVESPFLTWRSMELFLNCDDLEREWYYREDFWRDYLKLLVTCRYNNLSLTFGHQTPYLSPPYPFYLEMPEFPQVHAPGFGPEERRRNLDALRRAAEMTRERGIHFTMGVWSQHACQYGKPLVEGLTPDVIRDYNSLGLRRMLESCPAIDGVQFRMNRESGVAEEEQAAFYEAQFRAVALCGRPIRVDLRAKGLHNDTIALARRLLPNVVVSTKFWCEHLGLPYTMPAIQSADAPNYRRYGTWDLLCKPRPWDLVHRLWSAGTQRALLWGDPEYGRRFAQGCRFGGVGFEVMAPLTNKGGVNERGPWRLITDPSFQPFNEEYRRFWMFYLVFGRLGFNPECSPAVWRREMRARFGPAAEAVESGYRASGQVLPLVTVALQRSASLWGFWPEMEAGKSLEADAAVEPSDPTQFYGAAEFVADALRGTLRGKWTPMNTAWLLGRLADETVAAVRAAESVAADADNPELRGTLLDFRMLAGMARFSGDRLVAAANYAHYLRTRGRAHLAAAVERLRAARGHWRDVAFLADGVYHADLVFGRRPNHAGHWKDRLADLDADIARLEQMPSEASPERAAAPFSQTPPRPMPRIRFQGVASARAGQDVTLEIAVESGDAPRRVVCHHRPAIQPQPFRETEMQPMGRGSYRAVIPGAEVPAEWDHMVFFELLYSDGGIRWPDWRQGPPYLVIETC